MSDYNVAYLNNLFVQNVNIPNEREKLAELANNYLKIRLREKSFARHVINPVKVTKADCQRAETHESLVKIIDIEPDSKAMTVNFRGEPNGTYITGSRYTLEFFEISSDRFGKTENELMSWEAPITKIIEDNVVKDIEYVEDAYFLKYVNAAITSAENIFGAGTKFKAVNVNTANDMLDGIIDGINLVERADPSGKTKGHTRPCGTILMGQTTYNSLGKIGMDKLGLNLRSEVTKDGYTYDKLLGKRLVVTMKTDLIPDGAIYFFAPQEYLGNFFILNETRFYINKYFNLVQFQGMEDIAMGIQNINACAKIQLSKI